MNITSSIIIIQSGISYDFHQENIAFESWNKTDFSLIYSIYICLLLKQGINMLVARKCLYGYSVLSAFRRNLKSHIFNFQMQYFLIKIIANAAISKFWRGGKKPKLLLWRTILKLESCNANDRMLLQKSFSRQTFQMMYGSPFMMWC